jgi:hypothetical protein
MLINRTTAIYEAAHSLEDCLQKDGFQVTVVVDGTDLLVQVQANQREAFDACPKTWKGFEVDSVFVGPKKRRSA